MVRASVWQWDRYLFKKDLLATYEQNSESPPLPFPSDSPEARETALNRKVEVSGRYDYQHEMIILNRRHASGPGHVLLTPMLREDGEAVLVTRGFIPFADREPQTWEKYRAAEGEVTVQGVLTPGVPHRSLLAPNSKLGSSDKAFVRTWLYPDLSKIAEQLPYPVLTEVYVQKIGEPIGGEFPAEFIDVKVPPSTHFGYTIEWALLALATLILGFVLQAFPRRRSGVRTAGPKARSDFGGSKRYHEEEKKQQIATTNGSHLARQAPREKTSD